MSVADVFCVIFYSPEFRISMILEITTKKLYLYSFSILCKIVLHIKQHNKKKTGKIKKIQMFHSLVQSVENSLI